MRLTTAVSHILEGIWNLIKTKLSKKYREQCRLLFDKRLSVCEPCIFLNKKLRQCNECGCFVDAKTKVMYKMDEEGFAISYIDPITKEIFYACPKRYW